MITAIGLIIGFYVLARYVEMYRFTDKTWKRVMIIIFAMITTYCMIVILIQSRNLSRLVNALGNF